jgi:putative flippase GtrA
MTRDSSAINESRKHGDIKEHLLRFARFCMVGGTVMVVDFTLTWFFCRFMPKLVGVSIAYICGVTLHFLLNKIWVFKAGRALVGRQVARYLINVAACWLMTVSLVWLALQTVTEQVLVAKAIALPPTTLLAFCLLRFYVFHQPKNPGN